MHFRSVYSFPSHTKKERVLGQVAVVAELRWSEILRCRRRFSLLVSSHADTVVSSKKDTVCLRTKDVPDPAHLGDWGAT